MFLILVGLILICIGFMGLYLYDAPTGVRLEAPAYWFAAMAVCGFLLLCCGVSKGVRAESRQPPACSGPAGQRP